MWFPKYLLDIKNELCFTEIQLSPEFKHFPGDMLN